MHKREPIDQVVNAQDTSVELARRLEVIANARDFSVEKLGLPDNNSYRSYADLERDFVVWNVFAAPEFSLQPRVWCFPVAGCVNYRGYFSEEAAEREGRSLREQGFDVAVAGIAAYSTLGRFDDPVLNTMMRWSDAELVATMFHELAHQVLYVKGDTGFNESFATVVEEVGIERWLASYGRDDELEAYRERQALRRDVMAAVETARTELNSLYRSRLAPDAMRRRKAERLESLAAALKARFDEAGRGIPGWLDGGVNNARLASMSLYHERVDEFHALLEQCDGSMACFYRRAEALADAEP